MDEQVHLTEGGPHPAGRPAPLQRLHPEAAGRVRDLFAGLGTLALHVHAVLDGACRGEVYVDDVAAPRTAFLASGDGRYVAGAADNAAVNAAINVLLPRDTYFALFYEPATWQGALEAVLADTYAVRAGRCYLTLQHFRMTGWREHVPEGFAVRRVDAALLGSGLTNAGHVSESILDEWQSHDLFLERAFGFCTVHGDDIASWSLVDYVHGGRCEIGIYTARPYRRRGLGALTAAATASCALERGLAVGWHCWSNNVGSLGVAARVGFEKVADYDVFFSHWVAENIGDMAPGGFRAFAENYERMFQQRPPRSGYPHLVTATAWSLAGDVPAAFRQLHRAVDLGWLRSAAQLQELWPEFFSIQHLDQVPEWPALAERLTAQQ